ncbi:ATP-binding protein [Streptomyces sp. NPDC047108]|uniref:ATP-binding protein n=1 Tax=Streptomyces sp. NPDC047108 TaxID=3155025 RepID=UPI0033CCFE59
MTVDIPGPRDFEVPHHPEASALARTRTRAALEQWGVDGETTHHAVLVVSELVANAVCHAKPQVTVEVGHEWTASGPVVRITVADGGPLECPVVPPEGDLDERGRGLRIVEAICDETGVGCSDGRHVRWAVVPET